MVVSCSSGETDDPQDKPIELTIYGYTEDLPVTVNAIYFRVAGTTDWGTNLLAGAVDVLANTEERLCVVTLDGITAGDTGYDYRIETSIGYCEENDCNWYADVDTTVENHIPLTTWGLDPL